MQEKTLFFVWIFPQPWPPPERRRLWSMNTDGDEITMDADRHGRLIVVQSDSIDTREAEFQTIEIKGAGRSVVSLVLAKDGIKLRINGREILLYRDAGENVHVVESDGPEIDRALLFPNVEPARGRDRLERLFLSTIKDIDEKLARRDEYSIIRAGGLLRQLLLDDRPLVSDVNRNVKAKLTFRIVDPSLSLPSPEKLQAHVQTLDPSPFPGARTLDLTRDQFLSTGVLEVLGRVATVRDVIRACAHVKGGVHHGDPKFEGEKLVIEWDEAVRILGREPSLAILEAMCRIVLTALRPLVDEITST